MQNMFSPASLEAQKLITVSIGKLNASRITRTGTSLHKSLLVASVLHRAHNVYLEEERARCVPQPPPEPAPVDNDQQSELSVHAPVYRNDLTQPCSDSISSDVSSQCSQESEDSEAQRTILQQPQQRSVIVENRLFAKEDEVATGENGEVNRLPANAANTEVSISDKVEPIMKTSIVTSTVTTAKTNSATTTLTTTNNVCSVIVSSTISNNSNNNNGSVNRKRRRVSDQETAAAVSSILPKRLRSELKEDIHREECFKNAELLSEQARRDAESSNKRHLSESSAASNDNFNSKSDVKCTASVEEETKPKSLETRSNQAPVESATDTPEEKPCDETSSDPKELDESQTSSSDGESDGEDTSVINGSDEEEMEVDKLTSLVSYFSFSHRQKTGQQASEYCLSPLHSAQTGPHVLALTA